MSEIEISVILVLVAIGSYCAGRLHETKRVLFWKIEWIKVEHKLARAEGRDPRECDDMPNAGVTGA